MMSKVSKYMDVPSHNKILPGLWKRFKTDVKSSISYSINMMSSIRIA